MTVWTPTTDAWGNDRLTGTITWADGHSYVSSRSLNDLMEFGYVIEVHTDGTVTEPSGIHGPEVVYVELDSDGQMVERDDQGGGVFVDPPAIWEWMHGYTGAYGQGGAAVIMHTSEFIGGRMARDILSQPGLYVAVIVDGLPYNDDENEDLSVGWAVAYRSAA